MSDSYEFATHSARRVPVRVIGRGRARYVATGAPMAGRSRNYGPGRDPRPTGGRCPATAVPPQARGGELVPRGRAVRPYAVVRRTRRRGDAVRGAVGAGRVGPPTGWHRLRLLRQIGDQLVPGVEQFLLVINDVA